jgi:hypothetical protein
MWLDSKHLGTKTEIVNGLPTKAVDHKGFGSLLVLIIAASMPAAVSPRLTKCP